MAAVKKGDFIEIRFVGRLKETGQVFDINDEEEAKNTGVYDAKQKYEPAVVCVGHGDVVKGLDEALEGKETGSEFNVEVDPEKGFGRRSGLLIKLLPASSFREQEIQPYPGMPISLNGMEGIVRSVSGGRILVDFNHPLAGRTLEYKIKLTRLIEDDTERLKGFMKVTLGSDFNAYVKENVAYIGTKLPKDVVRELEKKLKERMPHIARLEAEAKQASS